LSRNNTFLTLLGAGAGIALAVTVARRRRIRRALDEYAGKVVLITGASAGIGEALALEFARRGAHLVLAARRQSQLERIASTCEQIHPGIETLVVPTDVSDEAQLERLVQAAHDRFGRIDVLVNNAGIIQGAEVTGLSREMIERTFAVNLYAPIRLTQLVLPGMLECGSGQIINIGSVAGLASLPYFLVYDVTKAGLRAWTEGLRHELHGTGVETILVAPGFVETDVVADMHRVYRAIGFFRLLSPQTVARRTLEGAAAGDPVVRVGWMETVAGYITTLFPRLTDLYWRIVLPISGYREMAIKHRTE